MPLYTVNPSAIHTFFVGYIYNYCNNTSFPVFRPQSVNGYTGYSDAPNYDRNWITTSSLRIRYANTIDTIITGATNNNFQFRFVSPTFVKNSGNFSDPANGDTLVQEFLKLMFVEVPTGARLQHFKDIFLGTLSLTNWRNEWTNYVASNNATSVKIAIDRLVKAIVKSPEFQIL